MNKVVNEWKDLEFTLTVYKISLVHIQTIFSGSKWIVYVVFPTRTGRLISLISVNYCPYYISML